MSREEKIFMLIGRLYIHYFVRKEPSETNFRKFSNALDRLVRKYNALRASSPSAESEV